MVTVSVACTSPPNHLAHTQFDIARFQPDCRNAKFMVAWAQRQLDQAHTEFSGDQLRSYRASVKNFIWETREKCKID